MMFISRFIFSILLFVVTHATGNSQLLSPAEERNFSILTSYNELQNFLARVSKKPGVEVTHIATLESGRSVSAVLLTNSPPFGSDTAKVRVLLFAQQHGDEPSGKEALLTLLAKAANGDMNSILRYVDVIVIPQMNPDGSELQQRRTADTVDLNRNHVLLSSPAVKALHDVYFRWLPHVTLDIHEYGSFSTSWSDSGFIKTGDVQLGMLTNPNTSPAIRSYQHDRIYPFLSERMKRTGYSFHEYIVGSPRDRIRHSTTEINDGRQSFGILGSLSFIQEGRKWKTIDEQLERRARSQLAAVEALLEFVAKSVAEIRLLVNNERQRLMQLPGTDVVVRMDHFAGDDSLKIPVHWLSNGRDTLWTVKPYHSVVKPLVTVRAPRVYLVPASNKDLILLLERHNIPMKPMLKRNIENVAEYLIENVGEEILEEDTLPVPVIKHHPTRLALQAGTVVVPIGQLHSLFLVTLLEPQSMWGLAKYPAFESYLRQASWPILRIEK
ncbi:DUF2817 domain-containing protein [Sphingobacteriales bacterium CHB3]|nr:DUF2817 domain-containing protein [Sphingobacteriales bacterium CHB3]